MKSKKTILTLAIALLLICAVGGTVAWLTAQDTPVTNIFTSSDMGVDLVETTTDYQMIPGWTIAKDPKVSVTADSEDAWLFVKVQKTANFDTFMEYQIADGWTELESAVGTTTDGQTYKVYYRKVTGTQIGEPYDVLKGNKVTVKGTVTEAMMDPAKGFTQPTMTFTAYASQLYSSNTGGEAGNQLTEFTAAQAWENIPK